jgi:hypothetical protein
MKSNSIASLVQDFVRRETLTTKPQYSDSNRFVGVASTLLSDPGDAAEVAAALQGLVPQSIASAVEAAVAGLDSNLVSWVLTELSGQLGGFTQVCEVKASISAKAGSPKT